MRSLVAGALLLAAASPRADPGAPSGPAPAPPIPWQDPSPFAQPFLQLPFDAPEPLAPGVLEVGVRTLYSNSIAQERAGGLSVDVSVETAAPTAFVRYGLPLGLELQLSIAGAVDYAGFLGRPIKFVEKAFDVSNPLRAGRPPAAARFRIARDGGRGLDWSGAGGAAGDPWIGLKRRVRAQDEWAPAIAWRLALEVPTAPLPWGSGLFELGTGLLAGWSSGATSLRVEADAMVPAPGRITDARLATRPHFALQLGVARRLARWATVTVQASTHTSAITGTGLDVVDGSATYLLAGVTLEPSRKASIAFALVENVLNPSRGADVSAVLQTAWRW